jgi:hypothetical protein
MLRASALANPLVPALGIKAVVTTLAEGLEVLRPAVGRVVVVNVCDRAGAFLPGFDDEAQPLLPLVFERLAHT